VENRAKPYSSRRTQSAGVLILTSRQSCRRAVNCQKKEAL